MLNKKNRISRAVFSSLVKSRSIRNPFFTMRITFIKPNDEDGRKFSVVVSKKTAPKAEERNKIRRRLYSAIQELLPRIKNGLAVVFFTQQKVREADFQTLKSEVEDAMVQAQILKKIEM